MHDVAALGGEWGGGGGLWCLSQHIAYLLQTIFPTGPKNYKVQ